MYSSNRLWQAGTSGVLFLLCTGLLHVAHARAAPPPGNLPAPASSLRTTNGEHIQREALTPDRRPPLPASREHLFRAYDAPDENALRAAGGCDVSAFASSSGGALVTAVKASDSDCLNTLYSLTGTQAGQVFPEAKMVTIANALQSASASYPGNNTTSVLQLVLYLRAGYYVNYYHGGDTGPYGATLAGAIRTALDAFVASSHFNDVSNAHGEILAEFVTLIDSSSENAHHLNTVRGILDRYDATWHPHWYMKSSVNSVFTVLFRGHYNADYRALVQGSGSGVLDTLVAFITDNRAADVGTDREYLLQNAAGELGRFLQYGATFHTSLVHPKAKAVLDQFTLGGPGSGIYVRIADLAYYYDEAHCAYFNLCSFPQDLEAWVLPAANARDCSATLRVRSQSLTSTQLDTVCAIVGGEEGYFHTQAQTGGVPVANDFNTRLEMVIYHSSTDYETYSGTLFGNDTNNGGVYLEGDPSNPSNQARFLAYEAEWLRPAFEVWNLTHEYIHYLDGRFNMYGDFGDTPMDAPYSAIWYVEGFAEYMSYSYRNLVYARAVTEAQNPNRWTLAQLFDTEYSTDYTRTYQWGYLASRFMFERHRDKIASFHALTRVGNYDPGYHTWLDAIRTSYNAEFHDWLVCFASHNGSTATCGGSQPDAIFADGFGTITTIPECTAADPRELGDGCRRSNLSASGGNPIYLFVFVTAGATNLQFAMSGGSGEADIYVRGGSWPTDTTYDAAPQLTGNNETVTIASPAANGWYYLMVKPRPSFSGVQIVSQWN